MDISDEDMLARLPGIRIDHDNKAYYRGLLQHRLLLNRCKTCGTWHSPPRATCPKCWSWDLVPTEISGKGRVYLFSFRNGVPAHGNPSEPSAVAAIELPEGVRFTTTIVNCPKADIRIGMPVALVWVEEDGMPMPAFQPASN